MTSAENVDQIRNIDHDLRDVVVPKMDTQLEGSQDTTLKNSKEHLTPPMDENIVDVEKYEITHEFNSLFKNNNNLNENCQRHLKGKKFTPQNSVLTDLLKTKHIYAIHNMFIVVIMLLVLHYGFEDYLESGSISLGVFGLTFEECILIAVLWAFMFIATQLVYTFFSGWAYMHVQLASNSTKMYIWDHLWTFLYIFYQIIFLAGFAYLIQLNLDKYLSCLILCEEQIRFMMKSHAFVRSNIPRVLNYNGQLKAQIGPQNQILPGFFKYFYFLFAPTLIYQDNYPRTKQIRWRFLLRNVYEIIVTIFLMGHIWKRMFLNAFDDYGIVHYDLQILVFKVIRLSCPFLFFYLIGFYFFLHSWHNAWAEGLQFADRLFYEDWWNSTKYSEYFRKWNRIVHDWLYIYIYRDLYDIFECNGRLLPYSCIFLISSIFHEYFIAISIGFFYPVLFIFFFGFGLFTVCFTKHLHKIMKNSSNIVLWLGLSSCVSVIFTLYSTEHYARLNCNYHNDSMYAFLIPHSWVCNKQRS